LNQEISKLNAAKKAVQYINDGMTVGLGTGSTSTFAVDLLGQRLSTDFQIIGMATSMKTEKQAKDLGIKLIEIDEADEIDIAIDGADEVSPDLSLIKGLGGALLREKKVEKKAKELIIIIDDTKLVEKLGKGPLPIEISVKNHEITEENIAKLGCNVELRIESNSKPFVTDNGNYICHCQFENGIDKPKELDTKLMNISGVIDTGLFINMATKIIIGSPNGTKIID